MERLADLEPGARILVLCHGNICRSPFAAALLARKLESAGFEGEVDSAGFIGPGRPSPPQLLELAAERGVDLSGHRSRLVTGPEAGRADLIFVMNPRQYRAVVDGLDQPPEKVALLGDLDPDPIETRAIPDPFGRSREVMDSVLDRIERCVTEAVGRLDGEGR